MTKKNNMNNYEHYKKCSETIAGLFGVEYKLGAASGPHNLDKIDCFKAVFLFVKGVYGDTIPLSYKGISYTDYCSLYEKEPSKAMSLFFEYIKYNFIEIASYDLFIGDIITFYDRLSNAESIGISSGNSNVVIITSELGAIMVNNSNYSHYKVYRWQQQYQ